MWLSYSLSVSQCWSGSTSSGLKYSTVHVYLTVPLTDLGCVLTRLLPLMSWTTHSDLKVTHLLTTYNYVSCLTLCAHTTRRHGDMTSLEISRRHVPRPWCHHAAPSVLIVTSWLTTAAAAAAAACVDLAVVLIYCIALTTNGLYSDAVSSRTILSILYLYLYFTVYP